MLRADENANRKMVSCGTNFLLFVFQHRRKKEANEKSFTLPWRVKLKILSDVRYRSRKFSVHTKVMQGEKVKLSYKMLDFIWSNKFQ
jgi:hypothetical protein